VINRPAVGGTLVGARTPEQLSDTLGALDLDLSAAQLDRLPEASTVPLPFPHNILATLNN
jgi:aryl-alcohol dehydrogenase-like predicted oxidoreductase